MSFSITQALWNLDRAGAERVVLDLLIECKQRGHDVRLLTGWGGGPHEADCIKAGIPYELGPLTKDRRETFRFFCGALTRTRPQIFHTHLGSDLWGGLAAQRLYLHPWIVTAHNDDQDEPMLRHAFRGFMYRRADHISCVSGTVKRYIRKEFNVAESCLSVIRNGINLSSLHPRGSQEFSDIPQLICIGRLTRQKGQDILLKALARIHRPWHLDLIGEGPDRVALERLAESLGIAPRVTFTGSVANVTERLMRADLVCVPSRWEGQSLALLEAAGSGVPVLAQDLPVFHESFDDSMLGYVSSPAPEVWTRAIEEAFHTSSLALLRAYQAELQVARLFSRSRMADEYLACYQKLIDTGSARTKKPL